MSGVNGMGGMGGMGDVGRLLIKRIDISMSKPKVGVIIRRPDPEVERLGRLVDVAVGFGFGELAREEIHRVTLGLAALGGGEVFFFGQLIGECCPTAPADEDGLGVVIDEGTGFGGGGEMEGGGGGEDGILLRGIGSENAVEFPEIGGVEIGIVEARGGVWMTAVAVR
jgi:hypothetical protein